MENNEMISQLLAAILAPFQAVTTAIDVIFSQSPTDINFTFVKNQLLQEESRHKNDTNSNGSSVKVTFAGGRNVSNYRGNGKRYFGRLQARADNTNQPFPFGCYKRGKLGHKRIECPEQTRRNERNVNVRDRRRNKFSQ